MSRDDDGRVLVHGFLIKMTETAYNIFVFCQLLRVPFHPGGSSCRRSTSGKKKKPILIRSAECSTSKEEKLTTHTTHGKKKLKDPRSSPHEEIKDLTGRRCAIFEIKANGASQREVEDSIKRFISPDGRVCVCVCVAVCNPPVGKTHKRRPLNFSSSADPCSVKRG